MPASYKQITRTCLALVMMMFTSRAIQGLASEVALKGKSVFQSCSNNSKEQCTVEISYQNFDLPWGSEVYLVSAWEGIQKSYENGQALQRKLEWQDRQETLMQSSAPFRWTLQKDFQIHTRSNSVTATGINFVFRIVLPRGYEHYDNGSSGAWGFFQANFPKAEACYPEQDSHTNLKDLSLNKIYRR